MKHQARCIRPDELDKLLVLYSHLHEEDEPVDRKKLISAWNKITDHPDIFYYFITEDQQLFTATCNMTIIPNLTRAARSFAVIENVVTHPDYRHRGLGRCVMKAAIDTARQNSCYKVVLYSNSKRTAAHQFYRSLGFSGEAKKGFYLNLTAETYNPEV